MTPKEMLTNRCFCPMPWTGLMYNFDGKIKNCIRSAGEIGNIKQEPIQQILTGSANQDTQQRMLDRQPGKDCYPCYDLEKGKTGFDIISDRVFYIKELKSVPLSTYDQVGTHNLHTVDIRWSNLCNFSCVYCTPMFSSRWAEEMNVTPIVPVDDQKTQFKQYVFEHAHQLRHVYMAGGEPLLMKENLELLEHLYQQNPTVNLRINTNLSKTNTRVFETICKFPNVHWTVSVESTEQEFEYIRHGGSWQDFLDNLSVLRQLNHKISFNMLHFLLNYHSIFECVDFLKSIGFHNNSFVIGPLLDPVHLNIRNLPDDVLQSVKHTLENRINDAPGYLLEDGYRNLRSYLDQPFEKDFKNSMQQLSSMDQRRKLDSSKVFKELYKIYQGN